MLIDRDGHVVLADFGLSRRGTDRSWIAEGDQGTIGYQSPEVMQEGIASQVTLQYTIHILTYTNILTLHFVKYLPNSKYLMNKLNCRLCIGNLNTC